MNKLCTAIGLLALSCAANAQVIYRYLPVHEKLHSNEKLIVLYSLSHETIECDINFRDLAITYTHGNFTHSITLPMYGKGKHAVQLQADHLPKQSNELQINSTGQFEIDAPAQPQRYIVRCVKKKAIKVTA